MSTGKTIAKSTGFLFSSHIFSKLLSFLIVVIITRHLGIIGFGKYSFIFAFMLIFKVISDLGISTYMFREVSKEKLKSRELINNVLTLEFFVVVLTFSVALIIARFWPKTNEVILGIFIVAIHELCSLFITLIQKIFNAYEKNQYKLYSVIIDRLLSLILSVYVLSAGFGLYGLLLALLTSKIITLIYCYLIVYKKFMKISFSINIELWVKIVKKAMPFWFTLIAITLYYQVDKIMLTAFKGYEVTGLYGAAATLITALTFIPMVIIDATFPAMSKFHHKGFNNYLKMLYKKSFYYLVSISIPLMIGIMLFSRRIIVFIYKEQFIESGIALKILAGVLAFIFLNHIMGYLLNSINKQHIYSISNIVCTLSNIIINLILIPKFSYIGAAFATIISQFINFCLLYIYTLKNGYYINILKLAYKPLISGLIMGAVIIYLNFMSIIYIVPIAIFVYLTVLFIMKGIGENEISLIKSFFIK